LSEAKNASAGLLSKQIPVAPIDWVTPSRSHSCRYSPEVYWADSIGGRNTSLLEGA